MKITYLGTAAAEGLPGLFCNCEICQRARRLGGKNLRTRSQSLIDDTLLIDFPADTYAHMLHYNVPLSHIHSVLITHTHQDHLYLEDPGLRFGVFSHELDGKMTLYGNDALVRNYDKMYRSDPNDTHLDGNLDCVELKEFVPVCIEGYTVTPLLANHDKNEKCFIYLIQHGETSLLYGNDTGLFPDKTWSYLAGKPLDLVSLDCTTIKYPDGNNHMGIADNLSALKKMSELHCLKPTTKVVLTHFSHNGEMLHDELQQEVEPYHFVVAYDGMSVNF